jgi:hypothetical protein
MDKVTFIEVTEPITGDVVKHALIAHADGSFTSMPKAFYEAQKVEHLTEIPTPDEA